MKRAQELEVWGRRKRSYKVSVIDTASTMLLQTGSQERKGGKGRVGGGLPFTPVSTHQKANLTPLCHKIHINYWNTYTPTQGSTNRPLEPSHWLLTISRWTQAAQQTRSRKERKSCSPKPAYWTCWMWHQSHLTMVWERVWVCVCVADCSFHWYALTWRQNCGAHYSRHQGDLLTYLSRTYMQTCS